MNRLTDTHLTINYDLVLDLVLVIVLLLGRGKRKVHWHRVKDFLEALPAGSMVAGKTSNFLTRNTIQ